MKTHLTKEKLCQKRKAWPETRSALESAIMGIAGTAPAFSVAVTTATIVAAVGVLSVGSIFYCGLIMFGIMLAFIHLSKISPNAGAAYAWVGHVFGKSWGFFTGWGLLVASVFFMVSATIPAATSTLVLIAPSLVESTTWVAITAAIWLTLVTVVVTKGIKHASYTQVILTGLETAVVFALIIAAFIQYGAKPGTCLRSSGFRRCRSRRKFLPPGLDRHLLLLGLGCHHEPH